MSQNFIPVALPGFVPMSGSTSGPVAPVQPKIQTRIPAGVQQPEYDAEGNYIGSALPQKAGAAEAAKAAAELEGLKQEKRLKKKQRREQKEDALAQIAVVDGSIIPAFSPFMKEVTAERAESSGEWWRPSGGAAVTSVATLDARTLEERKIDEAIPLPLALWQKQEQERTATTTKATPAPTTPQWQTKSLFDQLNEQRQDLAHVKIDRKRTRAADKPKDSMGHFSNQAHYMAKRPPKGGLRAKLSY